MQIELHSTKTPYSSMTLSFRWVIYIPIEAERIEREEKEERKTDDERIECVVVLRRDKKDPNKLTQIKMKYKEPQAGTS